jgi:ATP-dependent Lhr-like helicase
VLEGLDPAAMLADLRGERRAARVRVNGQERWIDAADAGLYRDALGAAPAGGLPAAFLEDVPDALTRLLRRYAATHGPFTTADVRARYGIDASAALRELERSGDLVRGELRPGGSEREWCDPEVLRRLRRASLAVLRKEIEPAEARELARFLPSWQGVDRHPASGAGIDRLREILVPLQGLALPVEVWEHDVLPRRVGAYSPTWMDQLCAAGEVVWIGAGALGRNSGRVALYFREDLTLLGPPPYRGDVRHDEAHQAIRARLAAGACFFTDLLVDLELSPEEIQEALWDLAWAGVVTNDAYAPLRAPRLTLARAQREVSRRGAVRGGRFGAARRRGAGAAAQVQGRWSLTEPLLRGEIDPVARRRAIGELLLERYGIVTREQVLAEGIPGGFSAIYAELSQLETLGIARRGYFLEGLGGAQFALPGAVERLRARGAGGPHEEGTPLVLAAVDPAQPYGAALPWPKRPGDEDESRSGRRPARVAGAYVVLVAGDPIVYLERGGRALQTLVAAGDARLEPALSALVDHVRKGAIKRVGLEKLDGEPAMSSPLGPALLALGFQEGPRRLTLSA